MDRKIAVLLVERDPQVAQLLLLLLAAPESPPRAFETVCVEDVEAGLRSLERGGRVDAVVLGRTRAGRAPDRLRALRRLAPGVPVVALGDFRVGGRLNSAALKSALGRVAA